MNFSHVLKNKTIVSTDAIALHSACPSGYTQHTNNWSLEDISLTSETHIGAAYVFSTSSEAHVAVATPGSKGFLLPTPTPFQSTEVVSVSDSTNVNLPSISL